MLSFSSLLLAATLVTNASAFAPSHAAAAARRPAFVPKTDTALADSCFEVCLGTGLGGLGGTNCNVAITLEDKNGKKETRKGVFDSTKPGSMLFNNAWYELDNVAKCTVGVDGNDGLNVEGIFITNFHTDDFYYCTNGGDVKGGSSTTFDMVDENVQDRGWGDHQIWNMKIKTGNQNAGDGSNGRYGTDILFKLIDEEGRATFLKNPGKPGNPWDTNIVDNFFIGSLVDAQLFTLPLKKLKHVLLFRSKRDNDEWYPEYVEFTSEDGKVKQKFMGEPLYSKRWTFMQPE